MYALNRVADRTRTGMPAKVATIVERLAFSTLPIISLVSPDKRSLSEEDEYLFRSVIGLGFLIFYDGVKYLKNLKIVAAGAGIIYPVLRYAHLNDLKDIKTAAIEEFNELIKTGKEKNFGDAVRWLEFERDDALALDGDPLPDYPNDIACKIF